MSTKNLDNDPTIMQKLNKQNPKVCHSDHSHSDTKHSLSSSSSSSTGGRADGISWISRRVWSVECNVPSWCCCWLTQLGVKPPSSWDGLEGVGDDAAADEWQRSGQTTRKGETAARRHDLPPPPTWRRLLLRRRRSCRVPLWPVAVSHVDEPNHRS